MYIVYIVHTVQYNYVTVIPNQTVSLTIVSQPPGSVHKSYNLSFLSLVGTDLCGSHTVVATGLGWECFQAKTLHVVNDVIREGLRVHVLSAFVCSLEVTLFATSST